MAQDFGVRAARISEDIGEGGQTAEITLAINPPPQSGYETAVPDKILDFGLARAASRDAGLTQSGAIVGTLAGESKSEPS